MRYLKKNEAGEQQFTKGVCPTCYLIHTLDIEQIKNIFSDFLGQTKFSYGHYTPTQKIGLVSVCHLRIDIGIDSSIEGVKTDALTDDAEALDKVGDLYSCLKRLTDDGMSYGYRIVTSDSNVLSFIIFIWKTTGVRKI